ncbi:MAG: VanW family protein [bacterium]|nr:VanW family protein [bacterium]
MSNLLTIIFIGNLLLSSPQIRQPVGSPWVAQKSQVVLAEQKLDLTILGRGQAATDILADNIRLNLHYFKGDAKEAKDLREPFTFSFTLEPGEIFAYHDQVLAEFKNAVIKTQPSHFSNADGYKTLTLPGSGVCYLASLVNWAASDAGLKVVALANHDFETIPGVPRKYGTAIYFDGATEISRRQNLYVVNNLEKPVTFNFEVTEKDVVVTVTD